MNILVGLGNPGRKYSKTKHNFGYWVVDELIKKRSLKLKAGKGDYLYAQYGESFLVKPTSYMNSSGIAVNQILSYYKASTEDLIIIYDDIDLPLGTIRFKLGGGSGGHKGIESVIYHLRTENFLRLKMGIASNLTMRPSEQYVLEPFPEEYDEDIKLSIHKACDGLKFLETNSVRETMNIFNEVNQGEQHNE